jgi:hypothetical protein
VSLGSCRPLARMQPLYEGVIVMSRAGTRNCSSRWGPLWVGMSHPRARRAQADRRQHLHGLSRPCRRGPAGAVPRPRRAGAAAVSALRGAGPEAGRVRSASAAVESDVRAPALSRVSPGGGAPLSLRSARAGPRGRGCAVRHSHSPTRRDTVSPSDSPEGGRYGWQHQ